MDIKDGPSLGLTAPEASLLRKSLLGVRNPDAISVKHRLDAVTTLWAQEKLGWSIEDIADPMKKSILQALASADWTEADGEAIGLDITLNELTILREEVADTIEHDYSIAMQTPEAILEDIITDIIHGETTEIIEGLGIPPLSEDDAERLESNEFHDRLRDIALGRYMLEVIDKHLATEEK